MDNFGIAFAGLLIPVATQRTSSVEIINSSGNPVNITIYGFGSGALSTSGGKIQIGKGTTPPTRQDFKIEVPFTNGGIEDSGFNNQAGGYNSVLGEITVAGVLSPVLGSGIIKEVTKTNGWSGDVLIFHDLINDVSFIAGQQVDVSYSVLI